MVDNIGFFGGTTHCAPIACSMAFTVATDDALVHRYRLLCSMPGVGPLLACTLIALLPELGCMSRKQVAALVGVAPYAFESGTMKGRRSCSTMAALRRTVAATAGEARIARAGPNPQDRNPIDVAPA
jgi:transposase